MMNKKYDKITQKLILQSMDFNVQMKYEFSLPETVFILREAFKEKQIREKVLGRDEHPDNYSRGFCLVASYYIMQTSLNPDDWSMNQLNPQLNHWYLKEKSTNQILDITFDQFYETPYYGAEIPFNLDFVYQQNENIFNILNKKSLTLAQMANLPLYKSCEL